MQINVSIDNKKVSIQEKIAGILLKLPLKLYSWLDETTKNFIQDY